MAIFNETPRGNEMADITGVERVVDPVAKLALRTMKHEVITMRKKIAELQSLTETLTKQNATLAADVKRLGSSIT